MPEPEPQVRIADMINVLTGGTEVPAAIKVLLPILNLPESIPASMVRTMAERLLSLTSAPEPDSGPLADA
jgi:hypothetical protein